MKKTKKLKLRDFKPAADPKGGKFRPKGRRGGEPRGDDGGVPRRNLP